MTGTRRVILLVLGFLPLLTTAQTPLDIEHARPWELKSYAQKAVAKGDVYLAIDYYERYVEKKPAKLNTAFELANLYRRSRDYEKALYWYDLIYTQAPAKYPEALYYKAVMEQHKGQYESALENFTKFKKAARAMKDGKRFKKLAGYRMVSCTAAPQIMDSLLEVAVTHLDNSINQAHIELGPIPLDSGTMAFASLRSDSVPIVPLGDEEYTPPHRQFYTATKTGKTWKGTGLWDVPFNLSDADVGNGALSPDGEAFYFSRCEPNWKNEISCAIWVSYRDGGSWSEPVALGEGVNDPRYTSTMPTVGTETKRGRTVLYFASNRPGGKGGMDIWYALWNPKTNSFKEAKNAGTKVNTVADELTPFYDNQGRNLYFSSDGWPGVGGLDVFRTTGEMRTFVEPANVGVPFNSTADDLYMTVGKNREEGFFVSNRAGGMALINPTCCDDIYFYSWTDYIYVAVEGKVEETAEDSSSTSPVEGARVTLNLLDEELGKIPLETIVTGSDGRYQFDTEPEKDYSISVEREGYFTRSIPHSTKKVQESDTLAAATVSMMPIVEEKAIVIDNIYYDFDKATLKQEAKNALQEVLIPLLKDNPTLVVEIGAHTDSKGSDSYNLNLSKNRAKSVVTYLVENGIPKKRLRSQGYGEQQLRVQDEVDGKYDEAKQALNRRTEFKVVGTVKVRIEREED